MIKAVAFDLDNTLIDFVRFKEETAKAAANALVANGLGAKPNEVKKKIWEVYDKHGVEYQKTFATLLGDHYKIRDPNKFERLQQAAINAYLARKLEVLRPYPSVKPTLRALRKKGCLLCIVTDAPRNKAWQRLLLCGLQDSFDFVITKDDTNRAKPSTLPFRALLKKTGLMPKQVLFVGDDPKKDIMGAKKVGMLTALAEYGWVLHRNSRIKPDFYLKRPSGILQILRQA
ncbi:MAG: HAD-IA family hydrolase [archaeon]